MDPLTQGTLGAAFGQASAKANMLAKAACIGAVAGMAPDLDVFIKSSVDPLLAIEYHRRQDSKADSQSKMPKLDSQSKLNFRIGHIYEPV